MKIKEKHLILTSLVSSIRYGYNENKELRIYLIDNEYTKELKKLFFKLNDRYFKNDEKTRNTNIDYINIILKEIKKDIIKMRGI